MKTPTWAIVIGICLILFGGCSASKSVQNIIMPEMLEMQKGMLDKIPEITTQKLDSIANEEHSDNRDEDAEIILQNFSKTMKNMFEVSEFTKTWTVRFGYIGLFVALIYILSGIFLLVKKPFSIKLVYSALIISIVFSLIQTITLASDSASGIIAMSTGLSNIFGIIIDVVLLIIVATMDKTAYAQITEEKVV